MSKTACNIIVFCALSLGHALASEPAAAHAENGCVACHQSSEFFARIPKLDRYYREWQVSPHGEANVTCDDCHGGDAKAKHAEPAHAGVLSMNDPNSTLFNENQPGTCGDCHRAKRRQFLESKHYAALMDHRYAPTCTTCHPAMNQRPSFGNIVLNACRTCHVEGNEEGLPLVADQAEEVFRQINVVMGFVGWARLHFDAIGWPDDSRQQVDKLEDRVSEIVDRIHRFDLSETQEETLKLRADLDVLFKSAKHTDHDTTPAVSGDDD